MAKRGISRRTIHTLIVIKITWFVIRYKHKKFKWYIEYRISSLWARTRGLKVIKALQNFKTMFFNNLFSKSGTWKSWVYLLWWFDQTSDYTNILNVMFYNILNVPFSFFRSIKSTKGYPFHCLFFFFKESNPPIRYEYFFTKYFIDNSNTYCTRTKKTEKMPFSQQLFPIVTLSSLNSILPLMQLVWISVDLVVFHHQPGGHLTGHGALN